MQYRPDDGHDYAFTVVGRCSRCQATEAEHLKMLPEPNPMTGCPADHTVLNAQLLIGEAGLEWRRCPYCHVMVEGALRTGDVTGYKFGPGRGDLTASMQRRLKGWFGWFQFNGGDEL